MKYIRTKDNQLFNLDLLNDLQKAFIEGRQNCDKDYIANQADTIEELCDEFVVIRDNEHLLVSYNDMKDWFDSSRERYGAIWTDKGLIYVAKMNEKGELELL